MVELDHAEPAATYMALWSMELALIGASIGGGIKHTSKLKVLNYKKAMRIPEAEECQKEICKEKARFDKYKALTPILKSSLPKGAKVLTTRWAMKLKSRVSTTQNGQQYFFTYNHQTFRTCRYNYN